MLYELLIYIKGGFAYLDGSKAYRFHMKAEK